MSKDKKKRKIVDKILMGAVIGGAIGSVLGATIAPKKGSETRKDIAQTADKAKKGGSKLFRIIKKWILSRKDKSKTEEKDQKQIPHEHV
jgi:gas vesicle protein